MPTRADSIVHHLRRAVLLREGKSVSDSQLLDLFISNRDGAAFEALVHRHGPMVHGVCRRLLPNLHDAEDAFQATFLVLAQKAASIHPRHMVGNWLYGVANTTAVRARVAAFKRRKRERQVLDMPEPAAPMPSERQDLRSLLDQELLRLADKYRSAIVLCDLQGRPRKEAARQLKIPEGTLSSRLTTARRLLAKRLARHGLPLSGAALAAAITPHATAACPATLVANTVKAATLLAAGQPLASGLITASVTTLMEGVLHAMFLNKLKAVTAVLVFVTMVAFAGGLTTARFAIAQQNVESHATHAAKDISATERAASETKDYEAIFNKVLAILGEYFTVDYANRYDGRIETLPALVPVVKSGSGGQGDAPSTIRRRATLNIAPSENGMFRVDVRVFKEAKWAPKRQTAKTYWDPMGRDDTLEQVIRRRLAEVPLIARDNLLLYVLNAIVIQTDAYGEDHGEFGRGRIIARREILFREGSEATMTDGGRFRVPIITGAKDVGWVEVPWGLLAKFKVSFISGKKIRLETRVELTERERNGERLTQDTTRKLQSSAVLKLGEMLKLTINNDASQPKFYVNLIVQDPSAIGEE